MQYMAAPKAIAQVSAILSHAAAFVTVTIMGFVCLWWEGLSLRQLYLSAEQERGEMRPQDQPPA